jgi:hypothetical protein
LIFTLNIFKSTPKKETKKPESTSSSGTPSKKKKDDQEEEEEQEKFDLGSLDDIQMLKDQEIWFRKVEYKGNVNYQIYCSGKSSKYSNNFYLHQVNSNLKTQTRKM